MHTILDMHLVLVNLKTWHYPNKDNIIVIKLI